MPVYKWSRFLAHTDGTGRTDQLKVVQEVLADLKLVDNKFSLHCIKFVKRWPQTYGWIENFVMIRIPFPKRQEGKSSLLQSHTQSKPCSRTTKTKHESGQLLSLNASLPKNSIRKLQWNMYRVRTLWVVNSILVWGRHKQRLSNIIFAKLGFVPWFPRHLRKDATSRMN